MISKTIYQSTWSEQAPKCLVRYIESGRHVSPGTVCHLAVLPLASAVSLIFRIRYLKENYQGCSRKRYSHFISYAKINAICAVTGPKSCCLESGFGKHEHRGRPPSLNTPAAASSKQRVSREHQQQVFAAPPLCPSVLPHRPLFTALPSLHYACRRVLQPRRPSCIFLAP